MAKNVNFTRDEVILALDVLYNSNAEHLGAKSKEIIDLSELLNALPIYPKDVRPENFRNCTGVSHQISHFRSGYSHEENAWNVGSLFFRINQEFKQNNLDLHETAEAIRKNRELFDKFPFGSNDEATGFPEGELLGHLHRVLENRYGSKIPKESRCSICKIDLSRVYSCGVDLLHNHLMVPLNQLDGETKYTANDFITVCPNCHEALHRRRPWVTKRNYEEILR